jgi:L-lactate dehydrogenase
MGMFDEIHCNYQLPQNPPDWVKNARFQTKDLENLLDEYTITAEGRLIHHCKEYEWVKDDEHPLGAYMRPIKEWNEDTGYHGDLVFYTNNITSSDGKGHFGIVAGTDERPLSFEYKARFTDGQVQWIRLVRHEDLAQKWQEYHKERAAEAEREAAEAADNENALPRYAAADLTTFATTLLHHAGLIRERAAVVADALVEADLMGHSTHGLQLLAPYLHELEVGNMAKDGEPVTIADHGSAITWDGGYLPGPWLMHQAMNVAFERIHTHPVVTIVIRRSHHIACLAVYPKHATDKGLLMLLTCSDPNNRSVAPYGGIKPIYTPNPLAAGIPTGGEPIILDISLSCTANGVVARAQKEGKRLPYGWLLDAQGHLTSNPAVLSADPPGSILPLGGQDLGYKGFALGILVEALTASLGGHGRADHPDHWGASVFLQMINPAAFGGLDAFVRETDWLADACRSNPVKPGDPPARLPGSRALTLRAEQLQNGIALYPAILPALSPWAEKFQILVPSPIPA